jgi:hypothetical protein
MAITWRQHIKNTMATMGKKTHLKDVLKAASKTWKSVKKDVSGAASAVTKTKRARKGSRKNRKTRRSTKRSRRGGSVVPYSPGELKGGLHGSNFNSSN